MSINQLFCTPEQGRRLKELVPSLTSAFVWEQSKQDDQYNLISFEVMIRQGVIRQAYMRYSVLPALTLQDLRDVIIKVPTKFSLIDQITDYLWHSTAPELAAWVIERLEETL